MRHYCKTCAHFSCEVVRGDGAPLEERGECHRSKTACKNVEADDFCNQYAVAKWAKKSEAANG